jgi:hypothetical protein
VTETPTEELAAEESAEAEDEEAKVGLPEVRGVFGVRLLIGALGLGGFVIGTIVAWHSEAATTLLIVSAVLIVLASLGLDWNKIRGSYGGWTFEVLRNFGERIEQVAAGGDVPQAVREELESLRAEVKAVTTRPRPRRASSTSPARIDWAEVFRTKATHSFRGTDAVQLQLRATSSGGDSRYRCTVTTPTGASFSATTRRPIDPGVAGMHMFTVVYPDEFSGSEPLVPGRYNVEWRSAPLIDPVGTDALAATLAQTMGRPIATDSFTIPDRRATPRPEPTS